MFLMAGGALFGVRCLEAFMGRWSIAEAQISLLIFEDSVNNVFA